MFMEKSKEALKQKNILPKIKNDSGNIMFWECFTASGQEDLVRVYEIKSSI